MRSNPADPQIRKRKMKSLFLRSIAYLGEKPTINPDGESSVGKGKQSKRKLRNIWLPALCFGSATQSDGHLIKETVTFGHAEILLESTSLDL